MAQYFKGKLSSLLHLSRPARSSSINMESEKQAQTTPDASFGPYVCNYFFRNHVLCMLTKFLDCIYLIIAWGRLGCVAMTKTGPNKVCISFFCNHVLCMLTNLFTLFRLYILHNSTGTVGLWCDDQNGPKQRGMYLFFLQPCFMHANKLFTLLFRLYLLHNSTGKVRLCCDDQGLAEVQANFAQFPALKLSKIFHFPSFTSIQCTVMPWNPIFVVSADHPSAVMDILPSAVYNKCWVPSQTNKINGTNFYLFF